MNGVHRAYQGPRPRISGANDTFPAEGPVRERHAIIFGILGKAVQTARDALSAMGKPVPDSLPETDRPTGAWVDTNYEPHWGMMSLLHYEGVPLAFYPPQLVNPQIHAGYGPFVQYPPISRGNPVTYGDTIPVLGE